MKTENIEKANKFFEKAVKSYQKNDYIIAKNNFEEAIKLNPKFVAAYYNLALLSNDYCRDYKKAKEYYEIVIRINPNFAEAYNNLAFLLSNDYFKDYEKAKEYYEIAIKLNPNYPVSYNNLALLLKKDYFKDYEKAKEYYEIAIKLNPKFIDAYNNLAILLEKDYFKDYEKAKEYYEIAIKLNPNYAVSYNNLANLLNNYFKDYEKKAKKYYEIAIKLNPNLAEAHRNLAILFSNDYFKDYNKAKIYFNKYEKLSKIDEKNYFKKNSNKINSINSVNIENYFFLRNIEIKNLKDKKEIYFLGENGDGKTILLQAIFFAFQQNYIKNYADAKFVGEAISYLNYNEKLNLNATDNRQTKYGSLEFSFVENIFAYGINRRNIIKDKNNKYNFMTLFNNKTNLNDPIEWFKELYFYELANDTSLIPLKNAIQIFHDILNENVEIKVNHKGVEFIEFGTSLEFHQLSDGYQSVLIWTADLITKLSKIQPNAKNSKDFEAVVLLDEIDLHLHPRWAYSIVDKLRNWFPKIQWIITTHSPDVIRGAGENAVFYKLFKEFDKKSQKNIIKISEPYFSENMTSEMLNTLITSPLFGINNARMRLFNQLKNLNTNDNFLYSRIEKMIDKYINANAGKNYYSVADIDEMIENAINEINHEENK